MAKIEGVESTGGGGCEAILSQDDPRRAIERRGLAATLREATAALHRRAERTGIVADILRGEVTRDAYALLLANLAPVYAALEDGLVRHRGSPGVGLVAGAELHRAAAIRDDLAVILAVIAGEGAPSLPLLTAGEDYVRALTRAADADGIGLIGHAYTRHLGDLSGGQVMSRMIMRALGLGESAVTMYAFPAIPDLDAYKTRYRAWLDHIGVACARPERVVEAACEAFSLNIALFEAVGEATRARA